MRTSTKTHRLLVFSDDWGRHPSSCQHLVRELLPEVDVTWVNTIGTRRPAIDVYTARRAVEKLLSWSPAPRAEANANPRVLSPVMWPSFSSRWGRALNRRSLSRLIKRELEADGSRDGRWTAVTTVPIVADAVEAGRRAGIDRWVYYCCDDLADWPELDRATLESFERELVERVDRVVVVSTELERRMTARGVACEVLTHGVDRDFWGNATAEGVDLGHCQRPIICFWGVVDRRLASSWLTHLDERLDRGTLLLVGPHDHPDPEVLALHHVRSTGAVPFAALPAIAREASVLVMPYADLAVTRAMQPLKLKEYLATGLPAVCADLPALEPWRQACDVVGDPVAFGDRVFERLKSGLPESQREARKALEGESWRSKAEQFSSVLFGPDKRVPSVPTGSSGESR